ARGPSDGVRGTAARLEQPRREVDDDRRRSRVRLHRERHAGERGMPAKRVRNQLARAPLESPFRVQTALRLRILLSTWSFSSLTRVNASTFSRSSSALSPRLR